jgi:L-alanine-DL-glutamate epimerase-like enolase superfamily enzyme
MQGEKGWVSGAIVGVHGQRRGEDARRHGSTHLLWSSWMSIIAGFTTYYYPATQTCLLETRVSSATTTVSSGFGQFSGKSPDLANEVFHRCVAPAVIGLEIDCSSIRSSQEFLVNLVDTILAFEFNYKTMGVMLNKAIAALDASLLDLLAKVHGVSVWEFWLGGKQEAAMLRTVPVYASSIARAGFDGVQDLVKECKRVQARWGISHFKLKVGKRMRGAPVSKEDSQLAESIIANMQGCKVAFDCNGAFASGKDALLGLGSAKSSAWFIEEPCRWYQHAFTRAIEGTEAVMLAGGEQEFRMDVWKLAISNRAFDICQPDCGYCGGPTSARVIALEALDKNLVGVFPHSPQPDMNLVYAWHLAMSLPSGKTMVELACLDDGMRQVELVEGEWRPWFVVAGAGLRVAEGRMGMDSGGERGWGLQVSEDVLRACEEVRVFT